MSYHMQLVLTKFIADIGKRIYALNVIIVAITYENNAKVDTHKFHTIQNNYTTTCQASYEGIRNQYINTIWEIK